MKFTYLLIDLFTVSVPFGFSFYPTIQFNKTWKAFLISASIVAAFFVLWDMLFIYMRVWSFNMRYVTGLQVYNLPVEEMLFFICIPFSCVFTYFCLDKFYDLAWNIKIESVFCIYFSLALLIIGIIFRHKWYTSVTLISTGLICLYLRVFTGIDWFGKAITVYVILLIPFVIVNGILTGSGLEEPVVRYNNGENLNIRFLTIPIEDFFYGFELFLLNLYFYKFFLRKLGLIRIETHNI